MDDIMEGLGAQLEELQRYRARYGLLEDDD
jgi:hypothetical protein